MAAIPPGSPPPDPTAAAAAAAASAPAASGAAAATANGAGARIDNGIIKVLINNQQYEVRLAANTPDAAKTLKTICDLFNQNIQDPTSNFQEMLDGVVAQTRDQTCTISFKDPSKLTVFAENKKGIMFEWKAGSWEKSAQKTHQFATGGSGTDASGIVVTARKVAGAGDDNGAKIIEAGSGSPSSGRPVADPDMGPPAAEDYVKGSVHDPRMQAKAAELGAKAMERGAAREFFDRLDDKVDPSRKTAKPKEEEAELPFDARRSYMSESESELEPNSPAEKTRWQRFKGAFGFGKKDDVSED